MSDTLRICPYCQTAGTESRLTPSPVSISTCMSASPGYYDEKGAWVPGHDPNIRTCDYWCSNGHRFAVSSRQGQPDDIKPYPPARPTQESDE